MGAPHRTLAASFALLAMLSAASARAEQFLLFDVEFTYTWDDAINSSPSMSHYYVNDENVLNTERPENWLSPVDFRNGTVHIRLEVIDRPPGDQTANWTLCYIADEGGYGCAQTGVYTSEGVFESDVEMTEWWNNDVIDWSQGIKQMDLIYKKSTAGLDHIHFFPELEPLLTPTTVRITMVQVAAGDAYDPSALGLDFGGSGGAGGAGGAENQAGAGGTGAGGSGGADTAGGSGAVGGSASSAGAAATGAAGSGGDVSSNATAGAAASPTTAPAEIAGSPAMAPIAQAGSTTGLPDQSPGPAHTASDQSSGCAVQPRSRDRGLLGLTLMLLATWVRRRTQVVRSRSGNCSLAGFKKTLVQGSAEHTSDDRSHPK